MEEKDILLLTILSNISQLSGKSLTIYDNTTGEAYGLDGDTLLANLGGVPSFFSGKNSVTTLASLPVTKRSIIASVSGATTLSLADTLTEGLEIQIKVYNTGASSINQPLPTTGGFESKDGSGNNISSISIPVGGSAEISIWSLDSKYIIKTHM